MNGLTKQQQQLAADEEANEEANTVTPLMRQHAAAFQLVFTYQGKPLVGINGTKQVSVPPEGSETPIEVGLLLDAEQAVQMLLGAAQQRAQQQAAGGLIVPGRNAPLPAALFDPKDRDAAKALLKRND